MIINKDCWEALLYDIPDNHYEIIIVDPPYNIGKDFGNDSDKFKNMDDYLNWLRRIISRAVWKLTDTGLMYVYGRPEILCHIPVILDWYQYRFLQWHYTNKTTPSSKFWQRSHESILCVWKEDQSRPNLQLDNLREPYTPSVLKADGKPRKANPSGRFGTKPSVYHVNKKGALPRDVIKVPALAGGAGWKERYFMCKDCGAFVWGGANRSKHDGHNIVIHPTQKPQALTKLLIQSRISSKDDGEVLILFAGSGAECITAQRLGLTFTAYEINQDYINLAQTALQYDRIKGGEHAT